MPPRIAPPPPTLASTNVPALPAPSRSSRPFLQTSKEWVVPPRPKPGRKSTKPLPEPKSVAPKVSQKACRERRQEYVVELEEKVRQLEAGEGDKCVFYQQQAQRSKAESTTLLAENDQLRREIDKLRKEVEALRALRSTAGSERSAIGAAVKPKTRALPVEFDTETTPPVSSSKRPRRSAAVRAQAVVVAATGGSSPGASGGSSSSMSRRLSTSSHTSNHTSPSTSYKSHSPPAYPSHPHAAPVFAPSPLNDLHPASPATASLLSPPVSSSIQFNASSRGHQNSCGFCATSTDCLCAEIGYEYTSSAATPSNPNPVPALSTIATPRDPIVDDDVPFANETTYEPAVPLRFSSNRSKVQSVWRIDPPAEQQQQQIKTKLDTVVAVAEKVLCSGDPSNCPACSDDPFGKAFCTTLAATVCSTPCANCPGNCVSRSSSRIPTPPPDKHLPLPLPPPPPTSAPPTVIDAEEAALFESLTDLPCCGDPELCGSLTCQPASTSTGPSNADTVLLPRSVEPGVRTVETVPCNEAWTVLKAHPNIAFANLQMLAEVVSKRTHCSGPVASPTIPAPVNSSTTTTTTISNGSLSSSTSSSSSTTRPQLVPQSTLQCQIDAGVRKRLTVERGAVNEALEMLDKAAMKGGTLRK
ncbi:uncharacterized protein JCM15063_005926 [Sporobolomyces koalae]|uniref:uncharacterized protein n=1 Tax=Sporobolomyces koalae TaxID=500713 RepID=UPI0031777311